MQTHTFCRGRSSGASWPIFHQQGIIVPFLNEWQRLYLLHAAVGWVADMNWWDPRGKLPAHTHIPAHTHSTHQSVDCLSFADKQAVWATEIHNLMQQNRTNVQYLIALRHSRISTQDEQGRVTFSWLHSTQSRVSECINSAFIETETVEKSEAVVRKRSTSTPEFDPFTLDFWELHFFFFFSDHVLTFNSSWGLDDD